jgi:hypothetical protein
MIYGYHERQSWASCLGVTVIAAALTGLVMLVVALEGVICILMAAPLWLLAAVLGGAVGYALQEAVWNCRFGGRTLCLACLALPVLMATEHAVQPTAPLFALRSALEIDAAPERVWQNVVSFAELPPPTEWLFHLGIAYPMRAEIDGQGVGAVRQCVFSTGAFEEPIEVWDEPRRLKFSVTANPPPMEEWTPYRHVQPPHLTGFLVSEGGQFLLTPLPGGRTRLEGTTWYRHHLWPAGYWQVWSDYIIHRIHLRVLRHIRAQTEAGASG